MLRLPDVAVCFLVFYQIETKQVLKNIKSQPKPGQNRTKLAIYSVSVKENMHLSDSVIMPLYIVQLWSK